MWISRQEYNKIIERYEKRIDDLLNRIMSANYSEYRFVKGVPIEQQLKEQTEDLEKLSRSDEDEYAIEQARLKNLEELEEKSEKIKQEIYKA